mgnify:CR=1 FL=1
MSEQLKLLDQAADKARRAYETVKYDINLEINGFQVDSTSQMVDGKPFYVDDIHILTYSNESSTLIGDLTTDGIINILDIVTLVNMILD